MQSLPIRWLSLTCLACLLCFGIPCLFYPPAAAADESIRAELGDTINLKGVLYKGDRVYLFLTGPGLSANGVVLTDISKRADQGQFTMVDVDSNQEWYYKWNTARIENEINRGTYIVYVTNEPVDKAHLGGSSTYKTLEVFLDESTTSRVSVSSGPSYTLNPEMHSSVHAPQIVITSPTPTPTTVPVTTIPVTTSPPAPVPTTKSASLPAAALVSAFAAGLYISIRNRR